MNTSHADFYSKHNISPVSQNITDLEFHFRRRSSLFYSLGITPLLVTGSEVLEFGPGSGHNSIYTASLLPDRYLLVDGNPKGVYDTKKILERYSGIDIQVMQSFFIDYKSDDRFDIVLAEGCVPHQAEPINVLKHLSSFTKKNGIFMVSTNNGISYLSEIIRRLAAFKHIKPHTSINEQICLVRPILKPHLSNLKSMSRPVDDWILDNIIQPLQDRKLLSVPDVINTLKGDFDTYNSSPKFIVDWRWYKDITSDDKEFNKTALDCYYKNNINLIDYRFEFPPNSVTFGKELEIICGQCWDIMCLIQNGDASQWQTFINSLGEIARLISKKSPETSKAIIEGSEWLQDGAPIDRELKYFPEWWGRGQQYVSFIKK